MTLTLRQIPSPNYGGSRGRVIWIIVHTAEGSLTVDSLGRYFANPASQVSSHVGIDDHEITQYVPYSGQAWTARSANPIADQAELCGFAAWTRAAWLKHPGMLENTAVWIADRCQARGIPAVKIGPGNVAARQPGVIGHVDITNGLHDGTHTDPGTSFPWDVVMTRVNAILHPPAPTPAPAPARKGLFMYLTEAEERTILAAAQESRFGVGGDHSAGRNALWLIGFRNDVAQGLAALAAGKQVDAAALAAALKPALTEAVQAGMTATAGASAAQIADELAKRLAA